MSQSPQIVVHHDRQCVFAGRLLSALELGRQCEGEEGPFSVIVRDDRVRLIIARDDEKHAISREHLLVEPQEDGRLLLSNMSKLLPIYFEGCELPPQSSCEVALPFVVTLGGKRFSFEAECSEGPLRVIEGLTIAPGSLGVDQFQRYPALASDDLGKTVSVQENGPLLRWLQVAMSVFQSAASFDDFFAKAAQAVVEMIGFDVAQVLVWEEEKWKLRAAATAQGLVAAPPRAPSRRVLDAVRREKKVIRELPGLKVAALESLKGISTVIAAPLLDRQSEVIGVVYASLSERSDTSADLAAEIQPMLLGLIATAVAAGIARVSQEKAAVTARVQFEQFFTPELSRHLAGHPDLLAGRDAEVTILFCDIRAFSAVSEKLGPATTVQWLSDVMSALSDHVRAEQGVLVDYIGDELMAMWGAPEDQPDHAERACRAALGMLATLPDLNARWQEQLGQPMGIGIGINSGCVRIGNTGTRHKFKFGPLGNAVNVASRVQGATKYLRTPLLITSKTRKLLGGEFAVRRLCQVRVVNIKEAVEVFELATEAGPSWQDLRTGYEAALTAFEQKDFRQAARRTGNLLGAYPNDGPCLVLLARAVQLMVEGAEGFDPVWELKGK